MKVTISIDQTPEELTKLAKNVRQLAQQQRYHNDETSLSTCADIMDKIVPKLTPPEPTNESQVEPSDEVECCPICGKSSEGGPHQACIDKLVDDEPEEVPE